MTEIREEPDRLPRSFEALGQRLGFAKAELGLRYGSRTKAKGGEEETEHQAFMRLFGGSILYAAERDPGFYRRIAVRGD